jgi:hypothetical protein
MSILTQRLAGRQTWWAFWFVRVTGSLQVKVGQILETIGNYADAYDRLEELQKTQWLPGGDQKTGVIGEFYALVYLKSIYPTAKITFGKTSQEGWDLRVETGSESLTVQVKTVSYFSSTRRVSPIHPGWDRLFLLYLDKKLTPIGFWEIANASWKSRKLAHRTMPRPGIPSSGSAEFVNRKDLLPKLKRAIQHFQDAGLSSG